MGNAIGGILKGAGKLVGYDSDAISDAATQQAAATRETADRQAQLMREQAKAAQTSQETMIAQKQAADNAQDLLNQPVADADVAAGTGADNIDDTTGKRTKPRDKYSNASISI